MLPIPRFEKNYCPPIPTACVLVKPEYIKDHLVKTTRNFIALGGKNSLSFPVKESLVGVASYMSDQLRSQMMRHITGNRLCKEMIASNAIDIIPIDLHLYDENPYIDQVYRKECRMAVQVTVNYYSVLSIDFLENLLESDRKLHRFVKNLIEIVALSPMTPYIDQDDIFHSMCYEDESDEDSREYFTSSKKETELFVKHFNPRNKTPYAKRVRLIKKEYPHIFRKLNNKQKMWVKYALNVIESSEKIKDIDTLLDLYELSYEEAVPIDNCFTIVWDVNSPFGDSHCNYLNDYFGNYGGALVILKTSSKAELLKAQMLINHLCQIMKFFYHSMDIDLKGVWNR